MKHMHCQLAQVVASELEPSNTSNHHKVEMGALVSSSSRTHSSISSKGQNEKNKKFDYRRGSAPQLSGNSKRSSIHRPVLQLQVKPDTIERVRQRTGSNGSVMVSRSTLRTLAADSAAYENLQRQSIASSSSRTSNHAHHSRHHSTGSHGSLDSMVLLQILEDEKHILITEPDNISDYDHLLPKGEFSHLCACTYGLMQDNGAEGIRGRSLSDADEHTTAIHYGKSRGRTGSILLTAGLSPEELKERIRNHKSPARDNSFRRSKSVSTLASYQPINDGDNISQRRLQQSSSTSHLVESGEWTLGESIIRTLSRRDMLIIDVDNPQSQSERAIMEAWPRLKENLKKWQYRSSKAGTNGWV